RPGGGVADRLRVLEREHAGDAQVQPARKVARLRTPVAGEEVDDAAVWPQRCPEDLRRLEVGLAGVHDQRFSQLPCKPALADEHRPLHVARRSVVVEIETAFPDGCHVTTATHPAQYVEVRLRRVACVVWMDS